MQKKLNWEAYTGSERNKVIDEVKELITINDGYIINFNMFSDLSISISIELAEKQIQKLHSAFSSIMSISDFEKEELSLNSSKECIIFLNISFSSGNEELKREIPVVTA